MKRWMNLFITMLLIFTMASPTFAASKSGRFSGTPSSPSIHTPSSSTSSPSSNVYRSGTQRPFSQVTNSGTQGTYNSPQPSTPTYSPQTRTRSGVGSFLGGMAVGGLLGSMFHPFSGGYGSGYGVSGGFPFMGLLMDVLLVVGVIWLVRKIRRRA